MNDSATLNRRTALMVLLGGLSCATGAAAQVASTDSLAHEREQQKGLPHSRDPFWPKLKACQVTLASDHKTYHLTPTAEVRALIGTTVTVGGFILPLDGSDRTQHFLLGVNTPVCFYHPPGEPNEILEVYGHTPIVWKETAIIMEGRFTLIDAPEGGVLFRLEDARVVHPPALPLNKILTPDTPF